MNSKIRVVVTMAVFNDNVMTDLEADAIAVVIASFDVAKDEAIAILQEDTASVVTVKVFAVGSISIERNVFNQHVGGILTG